MCLLDRHFNDGDGVAAIGDVIAASPGTRVLILTADGDIESIMQAVQAGACGYVHKTWGVRALIEAVERIINGEIVIEAPKQTRQRPRNTETRNTETRRLAAHLTARERECLVLLVEGLDTRAMTAKLGVSATTIRSHVQAVLAKLGAHSRLEAAALAVRYNLVDHDQQAPPAEGFRR